MLIVLLSYSKSYCQSDTTFIPFYGGADASYSILGDSNVLVPIDDIRRANTKFIELKYLKLEDSINKQIIINDSIIITNLKSNIDKTQKIYNAELDYKDYTIKQIKKQRNTARITALASLLLLLVSLFK